MDNVNAFLGYFFSYGIVFLSFVIIAGIGIAIGTTLRKNKNAQLPAAEAKEPAKG